MKITTSNLCTNLNHLADWLSWRQASLKKRLVLVLVNGFFFAITAWIDWKTYNALFQHLYYLPIIACAIEFGYMGGGIAAALSMVMYHFVNTDLKSLTYVQGDVVQMFLFLAVGLVTAKLAEDARKMKRLALTDDLTGLYNLRSFEKILTGCVQECYRLHRPLALMVIDFDHLKNLNDCFGHLVGCEAVRYVGHVLARHLPPKAVACRYGGDEFVLVIPNCTSSEARAIAERIRKNVYNSVLCLGGNEFPAGSLSVSIGSAVSVPSTPHSLDEFGEMLFRLADQALYESKDKGRNTVTCSFAYGQNQADWVPRGVSRAGV